MWNCPLDQRWATFTGISPDTLLAEVKLGRSDVEMLGWVMANLRPVRQQWEIVAWSAWLEALAPGDAQRHENFAKELTARAPKRDDIRTTFDRLDLDDYLSFGGRA